MRRIFPMVVPMVLLLAACTAPSQQPTAGTSTPAKSSASPTVQPGEPPSSGPGSQGTGDGEPSAGEDEPGRFAYRCGSLDASPEVQLSSLAEVWAATNYTRMASCEVSYEGAEPFEPTPREAEAIATVEAQSPGAIDEIAVMLDVLRLCTRVSEETGQGGFEESSRGTLRAAADFCPDAPQGKIIAAWAEGSRFGDGSHEVGDTINAGGIQLIKSGPAASECSWSVTGSDGSEVAGGGLNEAAKSIPLEAGQKFTSDKCGIWGKMY